MPIKSDKIDSAITLKEFLTLLRAPKISSEDVLRAYEFAPWDTCPLTYTSLAPDPLSCFDISLDRINTLVVPALNLGIVEESTMRKSNNSHEMEVDIEQFELWKCTSTDQLRQWQAIETERAALYHLNQPSLTDEVKSATYYDTNLMDTVNRTHISEFFRYQEEATGIDTPGSDLPE